jgi:predicted nucleic acid-binding protein
VLNTSPCIVLGKTGLLHLPFKLARAVALPHGVAAEIRAGESGDLARKALEELPGGTVVRAPEIPPEVAAWDLGRGETEVLAFALANPGFEAVIDDRAARNCAKALGVPVLGTLGLILLARVNGLIPAVKPLLFEIRDAGLYVSPDLARHVLLRAGEL